MLTDRRSELPDIHNVHSNSFAQVSNAWFSYYYFKLNEFHLERRSLRKGAPSTVFSSPPQHKHCLYRDYDDDHHSCYSCELGNVEQETRIICRRSVQSKKKALCGDHVYLYIYDLYLCLNRWTDFLNIR
jgi:hypothetical protein